MSSSVVPRRPRASGRRCGACHREAQAARAGFSRSRPRRRGSSRTDAPRGPPDARSPADPRTRRIWPPLSLVDACAPRDPQAVPTRNKLVRTNSAPSSKASFASNPAAARMSSATVGRCRCSLRVLKRQRQPCRTGPCGGHAVDRGRCRSVGLISPASIQASVRLALNPVSQPVIRSPSPSRDVEGQTERRRGNLPRASPRRNRWPNYRAHADDRLRACCFQAVRVPGARTGDLPSQAPGGNPCSESTGLPAGNGRPAGLPQLSSTTAEWPDDGGGSTIRPSARADHAGRHARRPPPGRALT